MSYKELGKLLSVMIAMSLITWAVEYYDLSRSARDAAIVGLFATVTLGLFTAFFMKTSKPVFAGAFPVNAIGLVLMATHPETPYLIAALIFIADMIICTVGLVVVTALDAKKVTLMALGGTSILSIAFYALLLGQTRYGFCTGAAAALIIFVLGLFFDRADP